MPSNLVKTKADEKLWIRAKVRAKEEGHGDNYAYITSIFMSMKKGKTASYELIRNIVASLSKANRKDLLEDLSKLEHDQWMGWSKSTAPEVSEEKKKKWEKNWVSYDDLPEDIKEMDRPFARKTLKVLEDYDLLS